MTNGREPNATVVETFPSGWYWYRYIVRGDDGELYLAQSSRDLTIGVRVRITPLNSTAAEIHDD